MQNDYELLDEGREDGLLRLRALRDIRVGVKAGGLGGLVSGAHNLDASQGAWVYGNARVSGDALVYGNAQVYGGEHYVHTPDGYTMTVFHTPDGPRLFAGCRCFTQEEAVDHWTRTRGGTPLGEARLAAVAFLFAHLPPMN